MTLTPLSGSVVAGLHFRIAQCGGVASVLAAHHAAPCTGKVGDRRLIEGWQQLVGIRLARQSASSDAAIGRSGKRATLFNRAAAFCLLAFCLLACASLEEGNW